MGSASSNDYEIVVQLLTEARTSAGLTQQELAKRLAKPQSFVSKYERRERRLDVAEVILIARALNIDPEQLLSQIVKAILKRQEG